jgi:uncharacterized membrane protein
MLTAVAHGELIALHYASREDAERAAAEVRTLADEHALELEDAAIAVKHDDGRIELRQTRELAVGEAAVAGGAIGLLLGIPIGLPVAAALLGIAGGGGVAFHHRGISNRHMKDAARDLGPEEAILFVLASNVDWPRVEERLAPYEGELLASDTAGAGPEP